MVRYRKDKGSAACAGAYDYPSIFEIVTVGDSSATESWLDRGVPVDYEKGKYNTPLWTAIEYASTNIFLLLLERDADVDWRDKDGATLLHAAADQPDPVFISILAKQGLDVNSRGGRDNWTPMMLAANNGHQRVVEALKEHGAKAGIEVGSIARKHYTALVFAAGKGHGDIVEVLCRDKKEIKKHGGLALRSASWGSYIDVVKCLLQHGADPNKSGKPSALMAATEQEHWEIVKLLKEHGAKE